MSSNPVEERGIKIVVDANDALRENEKVIKSNEQVAKSFDSIQKASVPASKGVTSVGKAASGAAVDVKELVKSQQVSEETLKRMVPQFQKAGASIEEIADMYGMTAKQLRILMGLEKEQAAIEAQAEKTRSKLNVQEQLGIRTLEAETRLIVQSSKERVAGLNREEAALKRKARAEELAARARRLRPTVLAPEVTTTFAAPPTDEQVRLAGATDQATNAIKRQNLGIDANIKKAALWALGLRSVWFGYIRIRRAITQTIGEIFKNTEEAERLTESWTILKRSLVLSALPFNRTKKLIAEIAEEMDNASGKALDLSVSLEGVSTAGVAVVDELAHVAGASKVADAASAVLLFGLGKTGAAMVGMAAEAGLLGDAYRDLASGTREVTEESRELENEQGLLAAAAEDQADASDKLQESLWRIQERGLRNRLGAEKEFDEELLNLIKQRVEETAELERDGIAQRERIALDGVRRLEAIARQTHDRRGAIDLQLSRRLEDIQLNAQSQAENNAFRHNERMLDIERRYRDKLRDIERDFSDSIGDAIARRDATAALKAIRERGRGLDDARRERDEARGDASRDFTHQNQQQEENLDRQRQAAITAHARQLEDLKIARQQQERELAISLQHQQDDLEDSLLEQEKELGDSLERQFQELQDHFEAARVNTAQQNAVDRALAVNEHLNRERAYAAHLGRMRIIQQQFSGGVITGDGYGYPTGTNYADGGQFVASAPTGIVVGDGPTPERVTVTPLGAGGSSVNHSISGDVNHQVDVAISRGIDGMQGRIAAAVEAAMNDVLRDS